MFIKIHDKANIRKCLDCHMFNHDNGFVPAVVCKGGSVFNDPKHTGHEILEGAYVRGAVTEADDNKTYSFTVDNHYYHIKLDDIIYLELLQVPVKKVETNGLSYL